MPLYHIQDSDRPMFVKADNFEQAYAKWKVKVADENDCQPEDLEPVQGIQYICDDDEFLT